MNNNQKILVTGSSGTIGTVVVDELQKQGYDVICIDINSISPVDLLKDPIEDLFSDIETVIHLAANPSQFISAEIAQKNIGMVKKVIEACDKSKKLKRIINASSINVYPYFEIYKNKGSINKDTPLSPNLYWPPGEYAKAKIEAEHLFEKFCKGKNIHLINLRFGHVSFDNNEEVNLETDWEKDLEHKTFLNHSDLRKIINKSIDFTRVQSYLCISHESWFCDKNILFPLD